VKLSLGQQRLRAGMVPIRLSMALNPRPRGPQGQIQDRPQVVLELAVTALRWSMPRLWTRGAISFAISLPP